MASNSNPTKGSPSSRALKVNKTARRPARPLNPSLPSGEAAPPEVTPSVLEELVAQYLREWPRVHLREVRQILEHSGYQLKGARRVAKTQKRLAGKLAAEVPAVAKEKAGKKCTVNGHSEESLAGLIEKLGIEERAEADEDMQDAF
ncbi:hypothetical protein RUND412_005826 [Rhizina undulata]